MNLPSQELFFDQFRFAVEADMRVLDDLMFIELTKFEILPSKYGTKQYPHRNDMQMSASDYHQFLLQVASTCREQMNHINDVFRNGVAYPFNEPEFKQTVEFKKGLSTGAIYYVFEKREPDSVKIPI